MARAPTFEVERSSGVCPDDWTVSPERKARRAGAEDTVILEVLSLPADPKARARISDILIGGRTSSGSVEEVEARLSLRASFRRAQRRSLLGQTLQRIE